MGVTSFSYRIWINGTELDNDRMACIESVQYKDTSSGSDLLVISMHDPNMEFLDDKILIEESKIKFEALYGSDKLTFNGFIAMIDLNFPNSGIPVLSINCMDKTYIMDRTEKKRTWEKKKVSDVVASVFKEYGLKTKIDATSEVIDTISQSGETDIQFIESLAQQEDEEYLVYVENDTGYFVKKKFPTSATHTLKYKENPFDILSFSPRITKVRKEEDNE